LEDLYIICCHGQVVVRRRGSFCDREGEAMSIMCQPLSMCVCDGEDRRKINISNSNSAIAIKILLLKIPVDVKSMAFVIEEQEETKAIPGLISHVILLLS
jgi:hypothetical protein